MTTRAQELLDASMELTLRPQKDDRKKLIAFIINEAAARLCTDCGELQCAKIVVLSYHRILGEETSPSSWC